MATEVMRVANELCKSGTTVAATIRARALGVGG